MDTTLNNNSYLLPNCYVKEHVYNETIDRQIVFTVYGIILPVIAMIGVFGNILNLSVLTHRSWRNLGRLERFVHTGLVALACADMGVCISVLPWSFFTFFGNTLPPDRITFRLIYEAFSPYFINTFMLASALFTTSLAIGRYLAIKFPLEMRARINGCFTRSILIAVLFASITMNIPRFWITKIEPCVYNGSRHYDIGRGPLNNDEDMLPFMLYTCLYFTIAIAIPLLVLAFCNIFLLKHINKPPDHEINACYKTPGAIALRKRQEEAGRLMTLVLAILVIMHIVLVTPAQLMYFLQEVIKMPNNPSYRIIVSVVNLLESCNFSFNFVLYCILNVHFRSIIKSFFLKYCCIAKRTDYDECNVGYKMDVVTENTQLMDVQNGKHTR